MTSEGLRERQKALARDAILAAAAAQISEVGLMGFSMPDIAKRANVSQRTVYNYFSNRDELVEALIPWAGEVMGARGGVGSVRSLDDLSAAVRTNFPLFDEMAGLVRAFARVDSHVAAALNRDRRQRSDDFRAAAVADLPGLDESAASAVGALLRTVVSSQVWDTLTSQHGLDSDVVTDVVAWAVDVIVAAAKELPEDGIST